MRSSLVVLQAFGAKLGVCILFVPAVQRHVLQCAGSPVRAAATVGGNLVLVRERALQSNLVPMLIALGATVTVTSLHSKK